MDFGDSLIPLRDVSSLVAQPAGANVNQLTAAITSAKTEWKYAYRLTITVGLSAPARFGVVVTPASTGAPVACQYFNGGNALAANALYTFTMGSRPTDAYQFQVDAGVVNITNFYVEAVCGGI